MCVSIRFGNPPLFMARFAYLLGRVNICAVIKKCQYSKCLPRESDT